MKGFDFVKDVDNPPIDRWIWYIKGNDMDSFIRHYDR